MILTEYNVGDVVGGVRKEESVKLIEVEASTLFLKKLKKV